MQRLQPANRFVDFPFLPAHSAQMYNLRLTSSVLKMEGTHYFIKGEKVKEPSAETKKNMHKHYAKHIEINSHFMLK